MLAVGPALTSESVIRILHALWCLSARFPQLVEQVEAVLDGFNHLPHFSGGKQVLGFVISFGPVASPARRSRGDRTAGRCAAQLRRCHA